MRTEHLSFDEIELDLRSVNRYSVYRKEADRLWKLFVLTKEISEEYYDEEISKLEVPSGSMTSSMPPDQLFELAELKHVEDYGILKEGEQLYTLVNDGPKATDCYYVVGPYRVDRLASYVGKDLGYPYGTIFCKYD